ITSASPHPPPIVPTSPAPGSITILLPTWRGTDPFVPTTVARTTARPRRAASTTACCTAMSSISTLRQESIEYAFLRGQGRFSAPPPPPPPRHQPRRAADPAPLRRP